MCVCVFGGGGEGGRERTSQLQLSVKESINRSWRDGPRVDSTIVPQHSQGT